MDKRLFSPKLAFEPLNIQEEFAESALRRALNFLEQNSSFYQRIFREHGLKAADIKSLKDMQGLPFTTKDDMQQHNWDFLCVDKNQVREYTATSGTMGSPMTIALTESDLLRLAYNEKQSFLCADGKVGDIYQLMLTLDRQFMAGMAYYSGIRAMGASLIRSGPGLPQMQWETMQRLGTNSLVAVPSFLLSLAKQAKTEGISLAEMGIEKAICIGENLRNADFSPSALAEQIKAIWPIKMYGTYAATELQTAFTECAAGKGGHQQPDLILVEIVDEAGNVLPDGSSGEIVVTTLGIEGMPLLRYKTGDIATLHAEPCVCGRKSKRLGPVLGRKGQMIKLRGTTIFPPAIFEVMARAPHVNDYVVELRKDSQGNDDLLLRICTDMDEAECRDLLDTAFQARLRVKLRIIFDSLENVQGILATKQGRKVTRFFDLR